MGRGRKRKGTEGPSPAIANSENGELKPISPKRSRRRVSLTAEALINYRIEVRRLDSKGRTSPKYERIVRPQSDGPVRYSFKPRQPGNSSETEKGGGGSHKSRQGKRPTTVALHRKIPTLNWTVCHKTRPKSKLKVLYFGRKSDKESLDTTVIEPPSLTTMATPRGILLNTTDLEEGKEIGDNFMFRSSGQYLLGDSISQNSVERAELPVSCGGKSYINSDLGTGSQNHCLDLLPKKLPLDLVSSNLLKPSQYPQSERLKGLNYQHSGKLDMVVGNKNKSTLRKVHFSSFSKSETSCVSKKVKLRRGNKKGDCSKKDCISCVSKKIKLRRGNKKGDCSKKDCITKEKKGDCTKKEKGDGTKKEMGDCTKKEIDNSTKKARDDCSKKDVCSKEDDYSKKDGCSKKDDCSKKDGCNNFDGQSTTSNFSPNDQLGPSSTPSEKSHLSMQLESVSSTALRNAAGKGMTKTESLIDSGGADCLGPYSATPHVGAKVNKSLPPSTFCSPDHSSSTTSIDQSRMGPSTEHCESNSAETGQRKQNFAEKNEHQHSGCTRNAESATPGYRKFFYAGHHSKVSPAEYRERYRGSSFSSSESAKIRAPNNRFKTPELQYLYVKQINQEGGKYVRAMVLLQMNGRRTEK